MFVIVIHTKYFKWRYLSINIYIWSYEQCKMINYKLQRRVISFKLVGMGTQVTNYYLALLLLGFLLFDLAFLDLVLFGLVSIGLLLFGQVMYGLVFFVQYCLDMYCLLGTFWLQDCSKSLHYNLLLLQLDTQLISFQYYLILSNTGFSVCAFWFLS